MQELDTFHTGTKGKVLALSLKAGLLTVLTLGLYRFWMKTRLRRYYWSAIRPGGVPLEYVGRPTEKLLGFLTAVVILAFYIGVVNLILMFFSFAYLDGEASAYILSFLGLVPFIFFAQYRSRRYVFARSRWRGIRFGLEPGVMGYIWRAMLYWTLTIVSLGLLWPLKRFRLEKYWTDRTLFGTEHFHQGGSWTMLIRPMLPLYIGAVMMVGSFVGLAVALEAPDEGAAAMPFLVGGIVAGGILAAIGLAHWRVGSYKRMMEAKSVAGMGFDCNPSTASVIGIYLVGIIAINLLVGALGLFFAAISAVMGWLISPEIFVNGEMNLEAIIALPSWLLTVLGLMAYFAIFLIGDSLREVFFTLPVAKHFAENTRLVRVEKLDRIHQRERDDFSEAEGFADALPLGGGF
ncbi:MAG: hypothetical protein CR993_04730 [Rhodobacterales bacterium]|nr:MAG: hypothetical protein CR993_04730 [Rhodobacterales bacterium]